MVFLLLIYGQFISVDSNIETSARKFEVLYSTHPCYRLPLTILAKKKLQIITAKAPSQEAEP